MKFSLGVVLSVTTGILLCPIDRVYAILNHMTADNLFTHQIPRACGECAEPLLQQFPQLRGIDSSGVDADNWQQWLAEQTRVHGDAFDVHPLPEHAHEFIDPISELAELVHPDNILLVGK